MNTNKLKAALVESGLSQRKLAEIMNVSKNTINAKINGKSPITINEAIFLRNKLNLSKEIFEEIFLR